MLAPSQAPSAIDYVKEAEFEDSWQSGDLSGSLQLTEYHNLYHSREDGEITAEFVEGRDSDLTRAEIGDGTWTSYSGQGDDDQTANPLFVSGWPAVNLKLQEDSPAIDVGSAADAPSTDAEGHPCADQPDLVHVNTGCGSRWHRSTSRSLWRDEPQVPR